MDYSEKLQQVDQLAFNGHHAQAVIAAASVLEQLLRHLYQQVQPGLSPSEQKSIAETMSRIGQGKAIAEVTLGQIIGVYREAQLFDMLEKYLAVCRRELRLG